MTTFLGIFKGVSWFEWLLVGALSSLLGSLLYVNYKNTNLIRDNTSLSRAYEQTSSMYKEEKRSSAITDTVVGLHVKVKDDITTKALEIQEDFLADYFEANEPETSIRGNLWELSDEKDVSRVDNPNDAKVEDTKQKVSDTAPTRHNISSIANGMWKVYCNADRSHSACPSEGTSPKDSN